MKFFCRHCDEEVDGRPYRVVSEENGVILLNMVVCRLCFEQARALGLRSEPILVSPEVRQHEPFWDRAAVAN